MNTSVPFNPKGNQVYPFKINNVRKKDFASVLFLSPAFPFLPQYSTRNLHKHACTNRLKFFVRCISNRKGRFSIRHHQ